MNPNGHATTLQASHPANTNAVRSGAYSRTGRVLAPRATEIAEALLEAPHTTDLDAVGAEEIGALVALLEALDVDIAKRGVSGRKSLVDLRLKASGRLERWLAAYGLTPQGRANWAATLASGGLVGEIERRREESPI